MPKDEEDYMDIVNSAKDEPQEQGQEQEQELESLGPTVFAPVQKTEKQELTKPEPEKQEPVKQPEPAQERPPVDTGWLNQDPHGNLVDVKGNVVFKAGMARRVYESWRQTQKTLPAMEKELVQLRQLRDAAKEINSVVGDTGLDPDSVRAGLELTAQFKKDPVGTIQQLIELTQARGHDTSRLGNGMPVTADAIARIIDAKLQPIMQQKAAVEDEQAAIAEGQREAQEFLNDPNYPFARTHVELIAHIVRNEGIDPRLAYVRLMHAATEKGLDFRRSLVEQLSQPAAAPTPARTTKSGGRVPALQTATPISSGADDLQFDPNSNWLTNLRTTYESLK